MSLLKLYALTGALALDADSFREGSGERLFTRFECDSEESRLLDCPHNLFEGISCTTSAVICQGKLSYLDKSYS